MTETVAVVLVTYNRAELLLECLSALARQKRALDRIFIIDNASTDGTRDKLQHAGWLDNPVVEYVGMLENTGGAGGFHEGTKRAFEAGYDWLWLMDDDVLAHDDCLEKLLSVGQSLGDARILCPNRYEGTEDSVLGAEPVILSYKSLLRSHAPVRVRDIYQHNSGKDALRIEGFTFEGPLIHRDVVQEIGLPTAEYFIIGDDTDFALRCIGKFSAYFIIPAKMKRVLPAAGLTKITWKDYYYVRNNITLLSLRYGRGWSKYLRPIVHTIAFLRPRYMSPAVKSGFSGLKTVSRGLIHGYLGLSGKRH
jgi:GT2 family glycosyltransferase